MKNASDWKPSKYTFRNNKLKGSRNPKELSISSRLLADIIASHYNRHVKDHVKGRLVDLGCGKVPMYELYKPYTTEVICADWENTLHKNPYLDYTVNLNEPLPFGHEEFDTIIISDVMEHLSRPEMVWKEMYRILRKDGKVILNVPFFYKIHEAPYDFYRYSEFALRNFARENGFAVCVLEPMGGAPEVLADISAKVMVNTPLIGNFLASMIQSFTALFVKTGPGRKLSRKTNSHYPIGYFMIVQK